NGDKVERPRRGARRPCNQRRALHPENPVQSRDREVVVTKHTRSLGATAKAVVVSVVLAFAPVPSAQRPTAPKNANWPLHNLDLAGSRFSTLDLINTSNVK